MLRNTEEEQSCWADLSVRPSIDVSGASLGGDVTWLVFLCFWHILDLDVDRAGIQNSGCFSVILRLYWVLLLTLKIHRNKIIFWSRNNGIRGRIMPFSWFCHRYVFSPLFKPPGSFLAKRGFSGSLGSQSLPAQNICTWVFCLCRPSGYVLSGYKLFGEYPSGFTLHLVNWGEYRENPPANTER